MLLTRWLSRLFQTGIPVAVWNSCREEHAAGHHHLRSGHLRREKQRNKRSQIAEGTDTKYERFKNYLISKISLHQC